MLGGWKFANLRDGVFAPYFLANDAEANLAPIPRTGKKRMKRLLRLLEMKRVDPTPLTTHRFPFDQLQRAFTMMETKEDNIIKPLILFD